MSRPLVAALVGALLLSFCLLSGIEVFNNGATVDEPVHLAAGYSYWLTDDYRLNPEHPPLAKRIAALPLFVLPWLQPGCDPAAIFKGNSLTAKTVRVHWLYALPTARPMHEFSIGHELLFGYTDAARKWLASLPCRTCIKIGHDNFLNNADLLLHSARLILLVFPLATGMLVFLWSRQLWGLPGALLSLTLLCFDPNVIAYSGMVLTDIPLTAIFFATVYFFYRFCGRATIYDAVLVCAFFALAQATKFSAVLLAPILLILAAARYINKNEWGWTAGQRQGVLTGSRRALVLLGLLAMSAIAAYALIWMQYSCRFAPTPDTARTAQELQAAPPLPYVEPPAAEPGHFPLERSLINQEAMSKLAKLYPEGHVDYTTKPLDYLLLFEPGEYQSARPQHPQSVINQAIMTAARWHLLPEAYLYGLAHVREYAVMRRSYLFGQLSAHSFKSYFLWAFLLKSTTVFLLLLTAALAFVIKDRRRWNFTLLCLLVPPLVYFASTLIGGLNLGLRHLMPIYPFLYVLIGAIGTITLPPRWQSRSPLLLAALLAAIVFNGNIVLAPLDKPTVVAPDYLTYFNEFAGGPTKGWESLLDSNLEYGQSLKYLANWLDAHDIQEPVYLCYVGGDDPCWQRIAHIQVTGGACFEKTLDMDEIKAPGYLAISITKLVGLNQSPKLTEKWNQFVKNRCSLVDVVDHCILVFKVDR